MTSLARPFLILFVSCFLAACADKEPEPQKYELTQTLASLDLVDPASDAKSNFAKGDLRLRGVNGFSCSYPGRQSPEMNKVARDHGIHCLPGTTDFAESSEHQSLIRQAATYSAAYNEALVRLIAQGVAP